MKRGLDPPATETETETDAGAGAGAKEKRADMFIPLITEDGERCKKRKKEDSEGDSSPALVETVESSSSSSTLGTFLPKCQPKPVMLTPDPLDSLHWTVTELGGFRIGNCEQYKRRTVYGRPQELTTSTKLSRDSYTYGHHAALRRYVPPAHLGQDLMVGYEGCAPKDGERYFAQDFDLAFLQALRVGGAGIWPPSVAIVTWRGILTKVLATPFLRREAWTLNIVRRKGMLFIAHSSCEAWPPPERLDRLSYTGFRFEQIATEGEAETSPDLNTAFNSIAVTKLGALKLVIGAEVDAFQEVNGRREYVELKSTASVSPERRSSFWRFKLLKFFLQSFLIGIPTIVVGFRNQDNRLEELKHYSTLELARIARQEGYWDSEVCLGFGELFFRWCLERCSEDGHYVATFATPFQEVRLARTDAPDFLPQWIDGWLDTVQKTP